MLSRSIWLVLLLTLATVTRSEHYHIVPVDSTDLCHDYRNGNCFTLEQLVQRDLLSGGDNLTLSFLPGDHVLTEHLLICNFSHVHIIGQNESPAVVRFDSNSAILFASTTELNIEHLGFVGANVGPQNVEILIIDSAYDIYINHCYFSDFKLLNQVENHLVKIANTQAATIESTLFMNNTGRVLHVVAHDVYITNNEFTGNNGGAVDIESNNTLINNTEFNYNSAWSGGAVAVVSGTVVITWCNFTNNKAFHCGGAIAVVSGSVSISDCELTNNRADRSGGAILVNSGSNVSISDSVLTNNRADRSGGAIDVDSGSSVSISDSTLINNRADKSGGAIDIDSGSSVSISDSTLTNNRADRSGGGAIDVDSSSVSISDSMLTNNRADGSGGAISAYSGSVFVSNSTLTNNKADVSGGAIYTHSGSIVSIFNSTLTDNRADRNGGAIDVNSGNVSIWNSILTKNRANRKGGVIAIYSGSRVSISSISISDSTLTNNRANNGGAISVDLSIVSLSDSTLTNNSAGAIYSFDSNVTISDSTLSNNSASGTIIVDLHSSVIISDSTLTHNSANEGGSIDVFQSSTLIINNTSVTNNMMSLNISQSNVTFTGMNIVSNNHGPIYAFNSRVEFNGPTTLSNNCGVFGGAISIVQSEMYINTKGVIITNNTATSGGGIFLRESTLFVNEPIEINLNTAQNGGGIYAYSSKIEFQSSGSVVSDYPLPLNKQSKIADNIAENGGGIYAVATSIKLTQSYVNIDTNTATAEGGGVYLQQNSKLYLFKKDIEYPMSRPRDQLFVKLMINNNSARYGGGIFVADDTESGACRGGATETNTTQTIFSDCFIQTIKQYRKRFATPNYFNSFMTNNIATQSGADIYGGLFDRCTASQNAEYHISSNESLSDYVRKTVKFSSISSRPIQVILCNHSQSDNISTKKGHVIIVSVTAVDQVGNSLNATIRSSVITESRVGRLKEGQAEQTVGNQCTELEYNVFSQDRSAQVVLYADGPCINLGISRQIINISFLPCTCPFGLKPIQSPIECKCDCDPVLQQRYHITNCFEENGTIEVNNIWIEVINTTNGTGYVASNCTFDYCVQKPINISLSNPDKQCAYNRSGVLCGECEPGLSLVLATSRCEQCSNIYLLLLIPFALAGILLVALILVLNITIATGTIHGLIFYANMLAANRSIFLPNLNNFLTVFISWVNLDLGIETCFYNGMNSQAKVLLQLVFSAYMFLLMFLIIILSKYFDSFAKLLSNRNPVAALGTLFLLSYSKLLRFIIAALQYRVLDYPDHTNDIVWLYDGNVQYFTPKHIPQFVAAVIILIVGGLFTVLLFFGQWFPRCSKVMKWTKNTKYIGFMDAYHAPFTPKHRYWVGLLLFALITHNLVTAMAPNTSLPILSAGVLSAGIIVWKLLNNRLYKNTLCGSFETLYLFNVAILAFGTFFVRDTKKNQSALAKTSMAISFTLVVIILCYHFYQSILKKSNTWLKIKDIIRKLCVDVADRRANNGWEMYRPVVDENDDDELLEVVDDYEQRDPVDPPYTGGAVEEADPDRYITPPIIRPATRPDQLRLSYMDELAPLTAEDHRQVPPPPRVNCHPVVTHTEVGPIHNKV